MSDIHCTIGLDQMLEYNGHQCCSKVHELVGLQLGTQNKLGVSRRRIQRWAFQHRVQILDVGAMFFIHGGLTTSFSMTSFACYSRYVNFHFDNLFVMLNQSECPCFEAACSTNFDR